MKKQLSKKQKAKIRSMNREQMVAYMVAGYDRDIREAEQTLNDLLVWMELHPDEPPLDLEPARLGIARMKQQRAKFIELNANRGPDERIEMPE